MIKSLIKKILNSAGYSINKTGTYYPFLNEHTMDSGLKRAKLRNEKYATIIDIGAASGTWTEKALNFWPNANYLLAEPLEERMIELSRLKMKYNNIEIMQSVIGDKKGKVIYSVAKDLDGSGMYGKNAVNVLPRDVDVITLDEMVNQYNMNGPFLIKMDTHGFEIPIFEGGINTLKQTKLIIVEVYGFYVSPFAILFYDLCKYLENLGFRPIDMVDIVNRRKDGAFWQCDIFFMPQMDSLFEDNSYV